VYRTHQAALHARQKLHGFEYPPGERLIVKLSSELKNFPLLDGPSQTMFDTNSSSSTFCSVNLPPAQPMSKETTCVQRCFIVCSPHVLPVHVLKQVFCRFGNLIDVYLLNNRNCGYVKYATAESAKEVCCQSFVLGVRKVLFYYCFVSQAMKVLHGSEIYGVRLKVLEAEEQTDQRKRSRNDD
jgi:hypothetical protein